MDARTAVAWGLVLVLTAVLWLLVQPFLGWLLATGLLAVALSPVHRRLAPLIGQRLSAGILTVLVVVLVLAPLALALAYLLSRGSDLLAGLSRAEAIADLERTIRETTGFAVEVRPAIERASSSLSGYASDLAPELVSQSLHAFLGFLLATFVLYYLLKDGDDLVGWLAYVLPLEPAVREELFASVEAMIWAVLKGHVLVAIVQGLVAGVALFVTGVPHAPVLTLSMTVLALVPIVGVAPVLGGAVVYLFLEGRPLAAAFVVVWGMTTVAVTDDYLRALLIDRGSEMHSAFIFVGLLGGTYVFGAVGLFVGPILVGLFKTTVEVLGEAHGVLDGR